MIITKQNSAYTYTPIDGNITETHDLVLELIDIESKEEFSVFIPRLEIVNIFRFLFDF